MSVTMSLVAAYSDSESDSEDPEEPSVSVTNNPTTNNTNSKTDFSVVNNAPTLKNVEPARVPTKDESDEDGSPHFQIEDDDDWMRTSVSSSSSLSETTLFAALPQPKIKQTDIVEDMNDEFIRKVDKFETVDEPLKGRFKGTGEEGSFSGKKTSSLILPQPSKGGKSKKGPVKISIPSLDDIGGQSDSDEDEDSKTVRKIIPACKKKSTLMSMLPKPKNSVTVGTNKNKMFTPQTNRPLVPHTLTKKKEPPSEKTSKKKTTTKTTGSSIAGDISDSDGEDDGISTSNFFSLGKQVDEKTSDGMEISPNLSNAVHFNTLPSRNVSTKTTTGATQCVSVGDKGGDPYVKQSANIVKKATPSASTVVTKGSASSTKVSASTTSSKGNAFFANMFKTKEAQNEITTKTSTSKTQHKTPSPHKTDSFSDVTGPYGGGVTGPYGDGVTSPYSSVTAPYGGSSSASSSVTSGNPSTERKGYPTNFFANSYTENSYTPQEETEQTYQQQQQLINMPNADAEINQDGLRQLQGSKRKHEKINIIDVQGPDVRVDPDILLRNSTTDMMSAQKKKIDEDAPTGQQKRKHQIQYLAHQAKERELQLQQQWAESRATKQVTQARYGF